MKNKPIKPRVLHIDDDEDFLEVFLLKYKKFFYITSISSSTKALEKVREENFDIIVTDYNLPHMNGIKLLEKLKEENPDLPVIFLTGQGNEEIARKAFIHGVSDYFTKDIRGFAHSEKLINSVKRALEIKSAIKEKQESEAKYYSYIDHSPDAVFVSDNNNRYIEVNESACRITGYTREELLSMEISRLAAPDDFVNLEASIEKLFKAGRTSRTGKFIKKDGSQLYMSIDSVKLSDNRFIAFCKDITQQKIDDNRTVHLNKVLRAIRNVNQLITQEKDIDRLISRACENLVETRGYLNSWIILTDQNNKVINFAQSGLEYNFSDFIDIIIQSKLPYCLKQIKSADTLRVIKDPSYDCPQCDLKKEYKRHNILTSKLEHKGESFGYISASVPGEYIDDPEEHDLFMELTGDIAFALSLIKKEEEKKIIEKALIESEEKFRKIFQNSPIGMFLFKLEPDDRLILKEANKAADNILGIECKKLTEKTIEEAFPSLINTKTPDFYKNVAKTGIPWQVEELEYADKDISGIFKIDVFRSSPEYLVSFFSDISQSKKTEEELRENEEMSRELLEKIPLPVALSSNEGKIFFMNQCFTNTLGWTTEEVGTLEKWWEVAYPGEDYRKIVKLSWVNDLDDSEKNEETEVLKREFTVRTKDGRDKIIDFSLITISDVNLVVLNDVTQQRKFEKKLSQVNQELNEFTYRVSHDLKNPLTNIAGYLIAIKDEPELFGPFFNKVFKQIESMNTFIKKLLDLSRAGKTIGEKREIDLNRLINDLYEKIKPRNIQSKLIIDSPLPDIKADPTGMEEVFSNLIQNSHKYRSEENDIIKIHISHEIADNKLIITINDNGIGINKEKLEKIFNPGFTISREKGTGFGLSIAKKIIEAHEGSIKAYSEGVNKGMEFIITLPL